MNIGHLEDIVLAYLIVSSPHMSERDSYIWRALLLVTYIYLVIWGDHAK